MRPHKVNTEKRTNVSHVTPSTSPQTLLRPAPISRTTQPRSASRIHQKNNILTSVPGKILQNKPTQLPTLVKYSVDDRKLDTMATPSVILTKKESFAEQNTKKELEVAIKSMRAFRICIITDMTGRYALTHAPEENIVLERASKLNRKQWVYVDMRTGNCEFHHNIGVVDKEKVMKSLEKASFRYEEGKLFVNDKYSSTLGFKNNNDGMMFLELVPGGIGAGMFNTAFVMVPLN